MELCIRNDDFLFSVGCSLICLFMTDVVLGQCFSRTLLTT